MAKLNTWTCKKCGAFYREKSDAGNHICGVKNTDIAEETKEQIQVKVADPVIEKPVAEEVKEIAVVESVKPDIDSLCDKYTKNKLKQIASDNEVEIDGRMSEKSMIEKLLDAGIEL